MVTKYIEVPPHKWGIVIVMDYDVDDEYDELMATLRSFGLPPMQSRKALNILSNYNTGMTVSLDDIKMSLVMVSKTTSESEFWDTLNHELYHANVAIIDYYGEPYDEDGAAHLQGYLMGEAVRIIGKPCN